MYLEHFKFDKFPFALTPSTEFFCHLRGHQEALNVLLFGVDTGEGFIKVIGEVGSGKTILCRKFLKALGDSYVTSYIPNPDLNPMELRKAFACELGIEIPSGADQVDLFNLLAKKLLALSAEGKHVVLVIDEAQALSDESLEALRLLTNLETESEKLFQVVLFAQPELDERLKRRSFRQLKQRITFSYHLKPIYREDLQSYLCHRLSIAGCTQGSIFDKKARSLLFRASNGMPRVINILCHKALLVSYGMGERFVGHAAMTRAIIDSKEIINQGMLMLNRKLLVSGVLSSVAALAFIYYFLLH